MVARPGGHWAERGARSTAEVPMSKASNARMLRSGGSSGGVPVHSWEKLQHPPRESRKKEKQLQGRGSENCAL